LGQGIGSDVPFVGQYVPDVHSTQLSTDTAALLLRYVPGGHGLESAAPVFEGQKWPGGQGPAWQEKMFTKV